MVVVVVVVGGGHGGAVVVAVEQGEPGDALDTTDNSDHNGDDT